MATDIPQRELRNETAAVLRRVEAGERLRITVNGHPVAELGPLDRPLRLVPRERLEVLRGLLDRDDPLEQELRELDELAADPFE